MGSLSLVGVNCLQSQSLKRELHKPSVQSIVLLYSHISFTSGVMETKQTYQVYTSTKRYVTIPTKRPPISCTASLSLIQCTGMNTEITDFSLAH